MSRITRKQKEQAIRQAIETSDFIAFTAEDYAECEHYTKDGKRPILFGNWNERGEDSSIPRLVAEWAEELGYTIEWGDEWALCDNCQKAVRTSPDGYSWRQGFITTDDGVFCEYCVKNDDTLLADYLASLEGNTRRAVTFDLDLEAHGYKRLPLDFENGFHEHQADDPKVIGKTLRQAGVKRFIFTVDTASQFDIGFSVHIHESEFDAANSALEHGKTRADVSPAEAMRLGLQAASKQLSELTGEGIRYAKIRGDGTAEDRLVSSREFIEGIKE